MFLWLFTLKRKINNGNNAGKHRVEFKSLLCMAWGNYILPNYTITLVIIVVFTS